MQKGQVINEYMLPMVQLIYYCKVYTLTLVQDPKGTPSGLPLFLLLLFY